MRSLKMTTDETKANAEEPGEFLGLGVSNSLDIDASGKLNVSYIDALGTSLKCTSLCP